MIIAVDFTTLLSSMDRSGTQKINKETLDLNHTTRHNEPKSHKKNIPTNSRKETLPFLVHMELSSYKLYVRSQNKSANLKRMKSYQVTFLTTII